MGLYYRIEYEVDDKVCTTLAPSCAVAFFATLTGKLCFSWVTGSQGATVTKVSVLSEDEIESYSIPEILDPKWVQPRKRKSV